MDSIYSFLSPVTSFFQFLQDKKIHTKSQKLHIQLPKNSA